MRMPSCSRTRAARDAVAHAAAVVVVPVSRRRSRRCPTSGDVLEVGCGHGLLSLYLALESPQRHVVGVDIDGAKIAEAKEAAGRLRPGEANVTFQAVDAGYVPDGAWDAVVVADVLYLLPEPSSSALLTAAANTLAAGRSARREGDGPHAPVEARRGTARRRRSRHACSASPTRSARGLTFVEPERMASWLTDEGLAVSHRAYRPRLPLAAPPDRGASTAALSLNEPPPIDQRVDVGFVDVAVRRQPDAAAPGCAREPLAQEVGGDVRRVEAVEGEGHDAGTAFVRAIRHDVDAAEGAQAFDQPVAQGVDVSPDPIDARVRAARRSRRRARGCPPRSAIRPRSASPTRAHTRSRFVHSPRCATDAQPGSSGRSRSRTLDAT